MSSYDFMADSLAEEILTEVAQNFFGKRRLIERHIQILGEYASELQMVSSRLDEQLQLLHFLLINPQSTVDFYKKMGVIEIPPNLPPKFDQRLLPIYLPLSFTTRQKYSQLVLNVYSAFQKSCHNYMHGSGSEDATAPDYRLFRKMCAMVNEEIKRLNKDNSPTTVIQYVKQFDVINANK